MNFSDEFAYKGPAVKKKAAGRGKTTETNLEKEFKKLKEESIYFDFERIPDAFSSRGGLATPRTGDFILFYRGQTIIVEAKETKNLKALPASNFSTDSRARLRRRARAGIRCLVVVYQPILNVYRLMTIGDFDERSAGSFDLDSHPALSLQELIKDLLLCSQS